MHPCEKSKSVILIDLSNLPVLGSWSWSWSDWLAGEQNKSFQFNCLWPEWPESPAAATQGVGRGEIVGNADFYLFWSKVFV